MTHPFERKDNLMKILMTPTNYGGCSWYRQINFQRATKRLGLANVQALEEKYSTDTILKIIRACDALHVRFTSHLAAEIMKKFKEMNPDAPIVFDTDDDLHNISPTSDAYEHRGTGEVMLDDGRMLWEQGVRGFDMYQNRKNLVDYEYCLEQADVVTVTNLYLARVVEKYNENVIVIPNAIDFKYWPELDITRKDKDEVRLVWAGGSNHYEDLAMIKPGLDTLMKKYPNLIYYHVGQNFPGITKGLPEDRVRNHSWIKADGHGYRMASIDPDIAIAPVVENNFNRSRSCVKFYEYSALKAPTVAAKNPPYTREVKHGHTGLLFETKDEFVKQVSELIEDPLRRAEIGSNAYKWVKNHRDVNDIVKDWFEVFETLKEAKEAEAPEEKEDSVLK